MKNAIPMLIIVLLLTHGYEAHSQKSLTADERAIQEVIENESRYFWARDLKNWKKCYVQEDYTVWRASTRDGCRQYIGWKSWLNQVKDHFKESDPEPYDGFVEKRDFKFRIYGDGAWVTFVQEDDGAITYETRILEKEKGQWKIAMVELIFHQTPDGELFDGQ